MKKRLLFFALAILISLSGCSDAAQDNITPNQPSTAETASYDAPTTPPIPVEQILFEEAPFTVFYGRTVQLPFTLVPGDATALGLTVAVADQQVASAVFDGDKPNTIRVTGLSLGQTLLTIRTESGITAEKEITVTEVPLSEIQIKPDNQSPLSGTSGTIAVSLVPQDVADQEVTLKSSDPKVLTINPDGSYEALEPGTAVITATHRSGITATCEISVQPIAVESVIALYNTDEAEVLTVKQTLQLSAEFLPENASYKTVTWTSSDTSIATVSKTGLVKCRKAGLVTITATAHNGVTAEVELDISPAPQKFKVSLKLAKKETNHVGNSWRRGFEFNSNTTKSGSIVSIMPGEEFTVRAWAIEQDTNPDEGDFWKNLVLTEEMCKGFVLEDDFYVYENDGRYSGNAARWHVKITFTPVK